MSHIRNVDIVMETPTVIGITFLGEDKVRFLEALQTWGLVPREGEYLCPSCKIHQLQIRPAEDTPDHWRWYCPGWCAPRKQKRRQCRTRVALRTGTIFARSHLRLTQILSFVNFWVSGVALNVISEQLFISKPAAVEWASFCREVLLNSMFDLQEKIGGPGVTVEIAEAKFGRRKYHRGRQVEGHIVFGGFERTTGRVFMVAAENRGRATLAPIIEEWVLPGTTVVSPCWKEYDTVVVQDGEVHLNGYYSVTFQDLETGAETVLDEGSWRGVKAVHGPAMRKITQIPGNLAKHFFVKRCQTFGVNKTVEFFRFAGQMYRPDRDPPQDDRDLVLEAEEEQAT